MQAGFGAWSHPVRPARLAVHVGDVDRLYPGKRVQLPVRIGNPYGHAIHITAAKVRVFGVEGCRRKRFFTGIHDFTPDVRIAAHGTWRTTLPFGHAVHSAQHLSGQGVQQCACEPGQIRHEAHFSPPYSSPSRLFECVGLSAFASACLGQLARPQVSRRAPVGHRSPRPAITSAGGANRHRFPVERQPIAWPAG
ncbi:MAG: hypothetical protein WKF82_06970 [Nocardioidaceae bacterium]